MEGHTEIAVAIAGQSQSRMNFRKLNNKTNGKVCIALQKFHIR